MSREGGGLAGKLYLTGFSISPPFSMGCWFRADLNQRGTLMAVCRTASSQGFFALRVRPDETGSPAEAIQQEDGGTNNSALRDGVVLGTWQYALAVFASNSSRAIHLFGAGSASETTALGATSTDILSALFSARGGLSPTASPGAYLGGLVAHAAIWAAAMDASDAAVLGAGANPAEVNKANLVGYWRLAGLASPEPSAIPGGPSLTVAGATAGASDPGVWVPWRADPTLVRGSFVG